MIREHLLAFLWLRWRLRINQFWKAGTLNAIFFFIFVAVAAGAAIGLFVAGILVGFSALPNASAVVRLFVWDGVIAAFLFFWLTGLLTDLQRSEGLAIDKVLHLPVSPSGAFLINYLSSLFSLTLLAFLPGMIGLILGEVFAGSIWMLLALPLLAAFVLAVTAITYQFQGWLATLMSNPRRRRTVIVLFTATFVLLAQLPNLLNMTHWWGGRKPDEELTRRNEQRAALEAELKANKITPAEYLEQDKKLEKEFTDQHANRFQRDLNDAGRIAQIISVALPPGWLAIGATGLAAGEIVPALLGTLGLGLMGAFSLWRAYRTTIRLYTGEFTGRSERPATRPATPADPTKVLLLERRIPWVSEYASAVAVAAFRSLTRAPEVKMALLTPLIMLVIFGGMVMSAKTAFPPELPPLLAFGSGVMVLFLSGVQLLGNQFGYDRTGFRTYVLSPIPRQEILLGKNLAVAPLILGWGMAFFLLVGVVYPMRFDYYPTVAVLLVAAYLVLCLLANALSILAPIPMAAGSMQPSHVKIIPALLQIGFMALLPLFLSPLLLPFAIEFALAELTGLRRMPVALALSFLMLAATVLIYRRLLSLEGNWLTAQEQKVLETVTSKEA